MPQPQYHYHSHHLMDESRVVDNSPSYPSPSELEPYASQRSAAQPTSAFNQHDPFMSLMPQSNEPVYQEASNPAPPPPLGLQNWYDGGPYFNSSAFHLQPALQPPSTPQLIVSGPTSHYGGHSMSPSVATGTVTGTIGSGTHLHYGSAHFSNSINSPGPRTPNYGPRLQASDTNFLNVAQVPQQYSRSAPNFGQNQGQHRPSLPAASNSSKSLRFPCTCERGFHESKSQCKKCRARREKPEKCHYPGCDYASATKNDLERHINCWHSDDIKKKHICPLCNRAPFPRIDNYKTHLEKVHADQLSARQLLDYVTQSKKQVADYSNSLRSNIPPVQHDDYSNQGQVEHDRDMAPHEIGTYDLNGSFDGTNTASDMDTSLTATWMGNGEYNMDTVDRPAQSLDSDADLMDEDISAFQYPDDDLSPYPNFSNGFQAAMGTPPESATNMAPSQGSSFLQDTGYTNYEAAFRRPSLAYSTDNAESALTPLESSQPSAIGSRPSMDFTQPTSTDSLGYFNAGLSRTTSRGEHSRPIMNDPASSSTVPQISTTRPALRQITTGPPTNHHNRMGRSTPREVSEALQVLAAHGYPAPPMGRPVHPTKTASPKDNETPPHADGEDPNCDTCQNLRAKKKNSDLRKHIIRATKRYFCPWNDCKKRCGSKDEQKKHANSQHYHVGEWRCGAHFTGPRQTFCKYSSYHRHSFINHINDKHAHALSEGKTAADVMKECVKEPESFPREMWCGYCRKWRRLAGSDKEIWDGWWNHVEDHLLGRKEMQQQKAEDWDRNLGVKPQRMMTLDCQTQDPQPKAQRQNSIPQLGEQMNLAVRGGSTAENTAIHALRKPSKRSATSSPERRPSNKKTGSSGRQRRTDVVCCKCGFVVSAGICGNTTICGHFKCMECISDDIRDDDDD